MTRRLILFTCFAFIVILTGMMINTGCGSSSPPFGSPLYVPRNDPNTPSGKVLTSIVVEPAGVNLAVGGMQQFKATAWYSDGSNQVVTAAAEWVSENTNIGKFEPAGGRFLAQRAGVAIVRARMKVGSTTISSNAGFVNAFNPSAGLPPAVPRNPSLAAGAEGVRIFWDLNSTDGDLAGYNVYRTQTSSAHYASEFGRVNPNPILYPPFLDSTVISGWYYYRVTAEDLGGKQSAPSEEVSVFVTGVKHYSSGYDGGISSIDGSEYKDAFSTAL